MWTNISNKTSTPKYPRLNGKQRFMGKEGLKRSGLIQDRGRHPINKKNKLWKQHRSRNAGEHAFETIELERFQEGVYFSFINSILRMSINTRCLMKDAILKYE